MDFELVGNISNVETIAVGRAIREVARLRKAYGAGRWRKLKGTATVRLPDGSTVAAEVHWYEAHGKDARRSRSSACWTSRRGPEEKPMKDQAQPQFVVCVRNADYPASLEVRKLYQVLPDEAAAAHSLLRVVDESGEDYLYPADHFVPVELPQAAQQAMLIAA